MHQEELSALIEKCREGDPQACEQLVKNTQNEVYFQCLRILKNTEDAQDAAQDILIVMLTHLEDLRKPESFRSWLARITICTCRKMHKRRSREYRQNQEAEKVLMASLKLLDDQRQPETLLDTEENRRMIVELVDGLPEEQRECVLLYYYSELPVKDIARIMGTSENTVKSRLYYARRTIKKGVDKYAGQGFKLYGVSPLPFLRYFLQQEAAVGGLGAAAAGLTEAVLAAAGAPAAAGGAAAIAKAILNALTAKKAAIAAGLLLVGAVGGVIYHNTREVTVETPLPQPPVIVSPAVPEEKPVRPPDPLKPLVVPQGRNPIEAPAEERPAAQPVGLTIAAPPEEPTPTPAPPPEEPESVPPPPPDAEPLPETPTDEDDIVEPDPGIWSRQEPKPNPESVQAPVPEPQPVSDPVYWPVLTPEPVTPVEEEPVEQEPEEPVNVIHKDITSFGANNGYGFTSYFYNMWDDDSDKAFILKFADTYSSTNPAVVYIDERGRFSTLSHGTAVLTASSSLYPDQVYTATIVVEEHFNWSAQVQKTSVEERESAFFPLDWTFPGIMLAPDLPADVMIQITAIDWSSSDETVAVVTGEPSTLGCEVLGVSPGTATFTGDVTLHVYTADTYKYMYATVTFDVTVDPAPEPETISKELTDFGYNSGYGYTSNFHAAWGDTLPSTLVYESSDPETVAIDETGRFTTLAPGTAVLTATDTVTQSKYVLTVQVQNCFQWSYTFVLGRVYLGCGTEQHISGYSYYGGTRPISGQWVSSAPEIAEMYYLGINFWDRCRVVGVSLGTAVITGTIDFRVETVVGTRMMQDTVSFQVTVEE